MATYRKKWTKQQLADKIEQARRQAQALKDACLAASRDLELNDTERRHQIENIINRMGGAVMNHLKTAAGMVTDMHDRLAADAEIDAKRANDAAHQMRLANTMKVLELRGNALTREEFTELVEPLAFDRNSQQMLKGAAGAGGMDFGNL